MIEDLIRPLVGSLPFDDILLATENGEIVYRSQKNGPEFTTLAALLENQTTTGTDKKPRRIRPEPRRKPIPFRSI